MPADQPHDASIATEGDVVHQTAHQEDAKAAPSRVWLDARGVRGFRKAVSAIFNHDRELVAVEIAIDGKIAVGQFRSRVRPRYSAPRRRPAGCPKRPPRRIHTPRQSERSLDVPALRSRCRWCKRRGIAFSRSFRGRRTQWSLPGPCSVLNVRKRFLPYALLCAIVACQPVGLQQAPSLAGLNAPSDGHELGPKSCATRVNDTLAKLEECIAAGDRFGGG